MSEGSKSDVSYTREDVEEITDFIKAYNLLEANNIQYENLETLEDLKSLLLSKLEVQKPLTNFAADLFKDIIDADKIQRQELSKTYISLLEFITEKLKLDPEIKEQVTFVAPAFDQKLVIFNSELVNDECPILVAGETSAGKSSLLNLILGEDVLPYSLLSATSIICNLKNSEQKRAVVHFLDPDVPAQEINLSAKGDSNIQELLNQYVNSPDRKATKYRHVDIFWPIPLLQGNVFIVDSPGIGENEEMTKIVMDYLPKAFAFIYVINSGNAGGVQEDRLERLLKAIHENKRGDTLQSFNPKSAIFVFNKWDQVPIQEEEEVRSKTLQRLQRCWTGLDPEKQVFYLSTTEAARRIRSGAGETENFRKLLDGIQKLVPFSLRLKVEKHYAWLEHLTERVMHSLRTRISNARKTAQEKQDKANYIRERLIKFEKNSGKVLWHLEELLEKEIDKIVDAVYIHINDEDTKKRLLGWNESEVPDDDNMEVIHLRASNLMQKALEQEITQWDERQGVFRKAQEKLMKQFMCSFNLLDDELKDVEGSMQYDNVATPIRTQTIVTPTGEHLFSKTEKIIIGLTSPLWVPLALVATVIALPIIGGLAIHEKFQHGLQIRWYKANRVAAMREWTLALITGLQKKDIKEGVVEGQLTNLKKSLEHMRQLIPSLIKADRQLINNVEADERSTKKQLSHYNPLYRACERIRGQLYLFNIRHLKEFDLNIENIGWDKRKFIANGSFARVYAVPFYEKDGSKRNVAAKVMREDMSDTNVGDFCSEEETLRALQHENIVAYVGIIYWKPDSEHLIMLTELCSCTLRDAIFKHEERITAKQGDDFRAQRQAFAYVCNMALQLAEAIDFIHSMGFIHRDLKLENILVTGANDDIVKVSDVGLTKPQSDISGTLCGTLSYLAPEVLESQPYNYKADMYSFGMILYEMWYAKKAYFDIVDSVGGVDQFQFVQMVKEGERPNINLRKYSSPCGPWLTLMTNCWEKIPEHRPTADDCVKVLSMTSDKLFIELTFVDPSSPKQEQAPDIPMPFLHKAKEKIEDDTISYTVDDESTYFVVDSEQPTGIMQADGIREITNF